MMFFKAVLIIDKRPEQSVKYKKLLEISDISVFNAHDLPEAFKLLNNIEPDLVLISDSIDFDIKKAVEQIRILTFNSRPEIVTLSKSNHIQDKIDILDSGADDFLSEPVNNEEFKARIGAHLRRNFENCFSEKTLLCGSKISYKMIKRTLNTGKDFAIILSDIDNFDSYKEVYGELAADKLLQTCAAIIKSATDGEDYAGQLSDNDFVIITSHDKAEHVTNYITHGFDTVVSKFYSQRDAQRGFMFLHGDEIAEGKVKPVSLSSGIISNKYKKYTDVKQIISSLIRTHKLAKFQKGSSYIMERPEISADNAVETFEKNMKILIAEPDESLSILLEATAKLQGYDIRIIENYEDVPSAVKEFNPSVIIMDAGDSEDLKGLKMCAELKFSTPNLKPGIILTTTVHDKELVLKSGADLYLPKPYELSILFSKIKKFNDIFNDT